MRDDKYSVGVPIIYKDHKKFIDIINKAIIVKENNDQIQVIDRKYIDYFKKKSFK